ncbi:MAG: family 10 glycosylhydrolase [Mucilaginibacter polytrichastri]|nr:family 10 glycosylhydrolase [Mucilaginibacter polytrichastri]
MKQLPSIFLKCVLVLSAMVSGLQNAPAQSKREFRGVWIATVVNIDWPEKAGKKAEEQKQELLNLLDEHQRNGMNAVMFQVRPAADAFYRKGREPWSQWLTGKQGREPDGDFDPLEFAIQEAHKRGMELHAWFNPYRAVFDVRKSTVDGDHVTRRHPDWFFDYGGKRLFNPGLPDVQKYIVQVILDVVKNYDIDGIHFDDYFYPYPVKGQVLRDDDTYLAHRQDENMAIDEWRRANVDSLIKMTGDSIHHYKKYVKFGVSPSAIWKNKRQDALGSETNGGSSFYNLYADSRRWVEKGWVDYINPQIYFPFGYSPAPYEKLVDWWSLNTFGRHLYVGLGAYRVGIPGPAQFRDPSEMPNEIAYYRKNPRVQGSVFFSSKSIQNNPLGLRDSLRYQLFNRKALPPVMIWMDDVPPNIPQNVLAGIQNNQVELNWNEPAPAADQEPVFGYVIYRFGEDERPNLEDNAHILAIRFTPETRFTDATAEKGKSYRYIITALDRAKNESLGSKDALASVPLP